LPQYKGTNNAPLEANGMKPFTASLADRILRDTFFGVSVIDEAGYIADMNHGYCSMIGYEKSELIGKSVEMLFDPGSASDISKYYADVLTTDMPKHIELQALHKSGHPVYLAVESFRHEDDGKRFCVSIATNITELHHTKHIMEQSMQVARLGGWEYDVIRNDLHIDDTNRSIHELDPGEQITVETSVTCYMEGYDRDRILHLFKRCLQFAEPFDEQFQFISFKGTQKWVRAIGRAEIYDNKVVRVYGAIQDVTEIEQAMTVLTQQNKTIEAINRKLGEHRLALDQSANIIITDADGYILEVNDHTCQLSGYSREELIGQHTRINKSGYHDDRFYTHLWSTIKSGQIWRGELNNRRKDGTLYWVETIIVPITGEDSKKEEYMAVRFDITKRKEHEERLIELNRQLEKQATVLARSNAEFERFAFVVSHDLQEPLRMISSFMSLLDKKYGSTLDDKARQYISFAENGAHQMRRIILDLLEYAQLDDRFTTLESTDVGKVLEKTLLQYRRQLHELGAEVKIGPMPTLNSYQYPLELVFQHILDNAIKYRHLDRTLVIDIQATEQADGWHISVKDNGIGIASEYFEKIFTIFQRLHLKSEYPGTGVGLSIVKKLVEGLGGEITVRSEEGLWTEFAFTVPKVAG
jgi:PAS domain S-box-containing protein